jgi:7-cyano-7-deazaguanine synthase
MKAVAIVSGGLDSVTLAHLLVDRWNLVLLSFDYGQRHRKEIEYAKMCAKRLAAEHHIIDLASLAGLLKGSALTDDIQVPDGHYTAPSMVATIVPNRNAVMLSIAYAVAVANHADAVAFGAHSGDHPVYPDCRPEFVAAFASMEEIATDRNDIALLAPFIEHDKTEIVRRGHALGVPFGDTWSCYKGGDYHCGTCGTCTERIEAFELAGVIDPTIYA